VDSKRNIHGEEGLNEGEAGCLNEGGNDEFGEEEAFPPFFMQPEDVSEEDILGMNTDDVTICVFNVDQMVRDAEQQGVYTDAKLARLRQFVEDSKQLLYPSCNRYLHLSSDLKLLQLKAAHGWTDHSFKALLVLIKDILPEGNLVADFVYEAKKIICPLVLKIEKIHACKDNCVMFHGEYEHLDNCPKCGLSWYKHKKVVEIMSGMGMSLRRSKARRVTEVLL
jgi:hypothetical protein